MPPADGGRRRMLAVVSVLARAIDVEVVSLAPEGAPPRRLAIAPGLFERHVPRDARFAGFERELGGRLAGVPVGDLALAFAGTALPAFRAAIAEAARGAAVGLASHVYSVPALETAAPGLPFWLDSPDHEVELKRAILPAGAAAAEVLERLSSLERSAWERAALVTAASPDDLAALGGARRGPTLLLANGVDPGAVPFLGAPAREGCRRAAGRADRFTLFFVGTWHGPNLEAIAAIDRLAPELAECDFRLAGTASSASRCAAPNVFRLGELTEAAKLEEMAAADLGLNPMRSGTGTNLKMLDYAAAGLPALTSPHGLRGLAFEPGTEVAVAPIEQFAAAIRGLARRPAARAAMARRARVRVERDHAWAPRVDALLRGALAPLLASPA
jgi:glycosyltransferase involved in cell wall biosynthesis